MTSILLLLFTANGIFEPLEVALNRAWGVAENRSYLRNQILSFFMIILCGGLALGSVLLTAVDTKYVTAQLGMKEVWLPLVLFKLAAVPVTILSLLLIYWLLPNRRVPIRRVFPVAVLVGIALELWKYVFLFAWPWLSRKLANEYPQFQYSVAIVIFSMLTALLVLAGAEWSARKPPAEVERISREERRARRRARRSPPSLLISPTACGHRRDRTPPQAFAAEEVTSPAACPSSISLVPGAGGLASPSMRKPINRRFTCPRERIRSTISCPR